MMIKNVAASPSGLNIVWVDASKVTLPWRWVMDHAEDAVSINHQTHQRNIDTFSLSSELCAHSATLQALGNSVCIQWQDGIETTISSLRLAQVTGKTLDDDQISSGDSKQLWRQGSMLKSLPAVDFEQVLNSDQAVLDWVNKIDKYGFCIINHTAPTEEGTIALAERIAPAQRTIFGTYWPLSSKVKLHDDTAYTQDFLSPHTDGCYYYNAAGLQMFNCLEFDGEGGESIVVDGFAIASKMKRQCPDLYAVLCDVIVPGHYKEKGVHLAAERPTFRHDRHGNLEQVTFNNYDRSPFLLPDQQQALFYQAYAEFNRHSMDQANWIKIPLRPGMALIFDNWRCLHGRMSYSGSRFFYGCYHDRADFQSRIRTLSNDLTQ